MGIWKQEGIRSDNPDNSDSVYLDELTLSRSATIKGDFYDGHLARSTSVAWTSLGAKAFARWRKSASEVIGRPNKTSWSGVSAAISNKYTSALKLRNDNSIHQPLKHRSCPSERA